jgi:nicotinamide riboside transporter PnuC
VLDLGCGKAELLTRIVEKYECTGTGVDTNPNLLLSLSMAQIPRNYSDRFLQGGSDVDLLLNKNVEWMNHPFFGLSYIGIVFLVSFILEISQLVEEEEIWTIVNVIHCVVRFSLISLPTLLYKYFVVVRFNLLK